MKGLAKVPSILGGSRPQVRDDGATQVRRVNFQRMEVQKQRDKLAKMQADLTHEEEVLDKMRESCAHCGACSACIG